MHKYDLVYYKNIIGINVRLKWKLFKLAIAYHLIRFAYKLSPEMKKAIEKELEREW